MGTTEMILGLLAGFISLIGFIPYFYSIFRGQTKPNKLTWWIWTWVGALILINYKNAGALNSLWVALIYFLIPLVTAVISIKHGVVRWTKYDFFCLSATFASTIFWIFTSNPFTSLVLLLLIDFFGAVPTIRKSYFHPEQENKLAWFLMVLANLINIFAVEEFKLSLLIYPFYMFITGSLIFMLTLRQTNNTLVINDSSTNA